MAWQIEVPSASPHGGWEVGVVEKEEEFRKSVEVSDKLY